ncbi:MAG: hypothetical protein O7A71_11720 [Chloroflexi bacterium]|nr:hypothetical protein [Chloroflexota bacterium]
MRSRRIVAGSAALLLVVTSLVIVRAPGLPLHAQAEPPPFLVTSIFDEVDTNPGDGQCRTESQTCTLRAATQEANALEGPNVILLQAGTYRLEITSSPFTDADTGDLDVQDDLVLRGVGSGDTVIDGGGIERVLHLQAVAAASISVTIEGVTIQGGVSLSDGGGIRADAGVDLQLIDVIVTGNSAANGGGIFTAGEALSLSDTEIVANSSARRGGGVAAVSGSVAIEGSLIEGNDAGTEGGGFHLRTAVTEFSLVDSDVRLNTAVDSGGGAVLRSPEMVAMIARSTVEENSGGHGAGVFWDSEDGRLDLDSSALIRNTSSGQGAALWLDRGVISLVNVTLSSNVAELRGGAIFHEGGRLVILNTTIAQNSSNPGGSALSVAFLVSPSLQNTIVAGNIGGDCSRPVTSLGNNLDSDGSCGFDQPGDLSAVDARLGPLALNGGPTPTHVLITSSPALDAGDQAACPERDQRGFLRILGEVCDIGAYEEILPVFPLVRGWNLVGWTDTTASAADATALIEGEFEVLFTWDSQSQRFLRFDPEAPPILNSLTELKQGDGVWILRSRLGEIDWPQPLITSSRNVSLNTGFNLVTWSGPDGASVEEAVREIGNRLVVLFTWDETRQRFLRFDPQALSILNTATQLRFGEGVWIEVSAPTVWRQPSP